MNYFKDEVTLSIQEVPGEITLVIPLAGCGHSCKGCHSPHYQDPEGGEPFTTDILLALLEQYKDKASCVCFFGGERQGRILRCHFQCIQSKGFKTALYTGYSSVLDVLNTQCTDVLTYLKIGHYDEALGGLDKETTNQRMYDLVDGEDITYKFWNKKGEQQYGKAE